MLVEVSFINFHIYIISVQFSSVAQSYPTLCDPMNRGRPGLPVHHQLLEFTQTHVHWVSDAIQPSHPLSTPSPPAFNLSQHQGLFHWKVQFFASGDQSIGISASASVLPMNSQNWFPLGWTGWISLQSKGLSRVFSNTAVQKHKFSNDFKSLRGVFFWKYFFWCLFSILSNKMCIGYTEYWMDWFPSQQRARYVVFCLLKMVSCRIHCHSWWSYI